MKCPYCEHEFPFKWAACFTERAWRFTCPACTKVSRASRVWWIWVFLFLFAGLFGGTLCTPFLLILRNRGIESLKVTLAVLSVLSFLVLFIAFALQRYLFARHSKLRPLE